MVIGDFLVFRNDGYGLDGFRNIILFLDLFVFFGLDLIWVCMKKEEDIFWV